MSSEPFLFIFYNYWVLYIQTSAALPIMYLRFSFFNVFTANKLIEVIFVCSGREMHTGLWWGKCNHTWKNDIKTDMK